LKAIARFLQNKNSTCQQENQSKGKEKDDPKDEPENRTLILKLYFFFHENSPPRKFKQYLAQPY
jgi:hypothetical protein